MKRGVQAGVYERLLLAKSSEKELEIVRDLSRTYPSHVYYQQRQGPGQRSLYNVLKAYSVYDRQVCRESGRLFKMVCQRNSVAPSSVFPSIFYFSLQSLGRALVHIAPK